MAHQVRRTTVRLVDDMGDAFEIGSDYELPDGQQRAELDQCEPDADSVDEHASEQRQEHVRERVDRVEAGPFRLGQPDRLRHEVFLKHSWVIHAKVLAHSEQHGKGQQQPSPRRVPDQHFLGLKLLSQWGRLHTLGLPACVTRR